MVKVEKGRVVLLRSIANEVNRGSKKISNKLNLLNSKNLTVQKKKEKLIKQLHKLLIQTISSKKLKDNITILRKLVIKLRDINYYLQTVFMKELGLKSSKTKVVKEETESIDKDELTKLEYTAYKLIEKIVFIDNKLLKDYKKKEEKITEDKKVDIKDFEKLIRQESELLCHLDAKLPPKFSKKILEKKNYGHWVATILSLLTALEHSYEKEIEIFKKLSKSQTTKKKLEIKIKNLCNEKKELLRVKEQKVMATKKLGKMEAAWEHLIHEWAITSKL